MTFYKACACGCGGEVNPKTAIAKAYGVTPALISGIVRGQHRASI